MNQYVLPLLEKEPFVSVIIANYNYEVYIKEAIQSVLDQTYSNFEIVICDDGSTDESIKSIKSFSDKRIKLIVQENGGMASALNSAYKNSHGSILCFLDADDYFGKTKIETVVENFKKSGQTGFVVHRVMRVNEYGEEQGILPLFSKLPNGYLAKELLRNGGIIKELPPCSGLSLRREIAELLFPLNESFKTSADAIIQRIAPLITPIYYIKQYLSYYRLHNNNITYKGSFSIDKHIKEGNIWEQLWNEQNNFLKKNKYEFRFNSLKNNYSYCIRNYVQYKITGEKDKELYYFNLMLNNSEHKKEPLIRRFYWLTTRIMWKKLFVVTYNFYTKQSQLKRILSKLNT